MQNTFSTLHNRLIEIREAKENVDKCITLIGKSTNEKEMNEALNILQTSYESRIFLENAKGLIDLKNSCKKTSYDPNNRLKLLVETAAEVNEDAGEVNEYLGRILDVLSSKGFKIEIELKPIDRTTTQGEKKEDPELETKVPEVEEEDPDLKEYDDFLAVLNEYQQLGEAYFLKDMDEAVVKDKAIAVNMKKKQFDSFIDRTFNKMIDDFREARKQETHDKICKRSIKLSKVVTHIIILFPLYAINPALAALSLIVPIMINKHTDSYYRTQMLNELKTEERIIDEKIKDADSLGEKGKKDKIKLMRLKDKVAVDAERIEKGWS